MVVAGHPAAATAGARMLERGGNAVDAAIAAAAAVGVVRPHMAGLAGDGFMLVYEARTRKVHALNAGGYAPAAATLDLFPNGIPDHGPEISTVPGIVDGWGQALQRFGRMAWTDVLAPAIELAEHGFAVYEALEQWIRHYEAKYRADPECCRVLMPNGRPPHAGEILVQPDLSNSLALLAKGGPRDLYEGELAARYVHGLAAIGGLTTAADLVDYHASWHEPVTGRYRGRAVHSQPPMSQGWMLVQMLQALDGIDPAVLAIDGPTRLAALAIVIRSSFEHYEFGMASAIAMLMLVMVVALSAVYVRVLDRGA
jgi:gamma-glutamyltranspeptidase